MTLNAIIMPEPSVDTKSHLQDGTQEDPIEIDDDLTIVQEEERSTDGTASVLSSGSGTIFPHWGRYNSTMTIFDTAMACVNHDIAVDPHVMCELSDRMTHLLKALKMNNISDDNLHSFLLHYELSHEQS